MLFSWQNNSTRCWDTTGSDDKSLEPGDEELTPIPQSNNNCLQEGKKCEIFSLVSGAFHDIQVNGGGLELSATARFITTSLLGDVKSELAKFDWQRGRVVLGKMDVSCVNLYAPIETNFVQHLRALDSRTRTTTSTRFSQYWVLLTREPASFWRENAVAVVILLRVLARMS